VYENSDTIIESLKGEMQELITRLDYSERARNEL
jgi:hypothetical protein